jgi:hypothetical protein
VITLGLNIMTISERSRISSSQWDLCYVIHVFSVYHKEKWVNYHKRRRSRYTVGRVAASCSLPTCVCVLNMSEQTWVEVEQFARHNDATVMTEKIEVCYGFFFYN